MDTSEKITTADFLENGFLSSLNSSITLREYWSRNPDRVPSLPPISEEDERKLDIALQYLQQNPKAAELIKKAVENGIGIVVVNNNDAFHYGLRAENPDGVIVWNPDIGLEFKFSDDQGNILSRGQQSPANMLLHELIHAVDRKLHLSEDEINAYRMIFPDAHDNYKYKNQPEMKAVCEANALVSAQHGELIRNSYLGQGDLRNPDMAKLSKGITDKMDFMPANSPVDFQNHIYNPDTGRLQYEVSQRYDMQSGTITRTLTNHETRDHQTEILDLDGNLIGTGERNLRDIILPFNSQQQDPACRTIAEPATQLENRPDENPQAERERQSRETDEPLSPLSQLAQRVLNSSRAELDQMGRDIANSPLGEQFRQRGAELWEERQAELRRQEQEAQERARQQEQEKAQQHTPRGSVMR